VDRTFGISKSNSKFKLPVSCEGSRRRVGRRLGRKSPLSARVPNDWKPNGLQVSEVLIRCYCNSDFAIVVTFCDCLTVYTPPHTLTRLAIRGSLISSYVDFLDVNPECN